MHNYTDLLTTDKLIWKSNGVDGHAHTGGQIKRPKY